MLHGSWLFPPIVHLVWFILAILRVRIWQAFVPHPVCVCISIDKSLNYETCMRLMDQCINSIWFTLLNHLDAWIHHWAHASTPWAKYLNTCIISCIYHTLCMYSFVIFRHFNEVLTFFAPAKSCKDRLIMSRPWGARFDWYSLALFLQRASSMHVIN